MADNSLIDIILIVFLWIYRFFDWVVKNIIYWIDNEFLRLFMLSIIVMDLQILFERRQKKWVKYVIKICYLIYSLLKIVEIVQISEMIDSWGLLLLIPVFLAYYIPEWLRRKSKKIDLLLDESAMHIYFFAIFSLWVYYDNAAGNLPFTLILTLILFIVGIIGGKFNEEKQKDKK
jgi:hypothetical protein